MKKKSALYNTLAFSSINAPALRKLFYLFMKVDVPLSGSVIQPHLYIQTLLKSISSFQPHHVQTGPTEGKGQFLFRSRGGGWGEGKNN